eukprot:TRINITY_DN10274_c0_g1_i1.p1 TRINITY_DN10274_c0_g1~~TRINITY_DN10274_c0_g1_i1.p1  ORF type:complete len:157 (+),score=27.59 TRINITY_DN10274_c0_g1_i1:99-569(+)
MSKGSDETPKKKGKGFGDITSPEDRANIFSTLTFWWATRLTWFAYRNNLTMDDLWFPAKVDRSETVRAQISEAWDYELKNVPKPHYARALSRAFRGYFAKSIIGMFIYAGAQVAAPEILRLMIIWVTEVRYGIPVDPKLGYLYAMALFLISMTGSF